MKKSIGKIKKMLLYWYWYTKLNDLEDKLSWMYVTKFNRTRRLTIWYMAAKNAGASDAIDYAFYKTYGLWGIDSLTENEKKGF